jgi:hypothetical protein
MSIKERKMQFIEKYISIDNESLLDALDAMLNQSVKAEPKPSIYNLLGVMTHDEAAQMKKVIQENCENINPDDWR